MSLSTNAFLTESLTKRCLLIGEAGDTPIGGHVDKDRLTCGAQLCKPGRRKRFEIISAHDEIALLVVFGNARFPRLSLQERRLHEIEGKANRDSSSDVIEA